MKITLFPAYLECEKCGFLAASKKDLQQHAKFHKRGPELKLFCEHCSFVTDAKSRLMRHKRIHTNVSTEHRSEYKHSYLCRCVTHRQYF